LAVLSGITVDIKEAELLDGDIAQHWYYRAKASAARALIGAAGFRDILDVGAGVGFFSREFLRAPQVLSATCVDPAYNTDRDEHVDGKPLRFRRHVDCSDFDLVLMMDVLEHVPDDVGLIREYADKVPSGAQFLFTVPAFQWLWSGHDVFLEHHRRYTLRGIERVVSRSGLEVRRGCYFYGALFPAAALIRLSRRWMDDTDRQPSSDMRSFSTPINSVFWALCRAELSLFRLNRLAGLTAFVHAVKP
jgi:SAM-dependent methyltransferase